MSSYFTITFSVVQSDNKLTSFTSFRHNFVPCIVPGLTQSLIQGCISQQNQKQGWKLLFLVKGKKKKDQNQQRKTYLTSQLSRFFCSVTKMISDKGSYLPMHCIQKGRSHTHHYCRQGLEDALSSLHLHDISPSGWYTCCTSNAVPLAYLDGATYLVPTHCCFPVPPAPVLGSHCHTMNQARSLTCLTQPEGTTLLSSRLIP